MKTRITDLFGIQYPIILSGMSWISTPELVAAVSNAGGLGILATGVLSPEETGYSIAMVRKLTNKPFAANVTLYFPGSEKNLEVILRERVPIVNYSLGKGDIIAERVHAYGGRVIATITTEKHALVAKRDGADALIVTGYEAAGHGGAATSMALIPAIADLIDIPVIAAGGFADGRGLAAALSLGAEGISMGTRFMNTVESPVHEVQKKMSVDMGVHDTLYTDRIDGMPARMMNSAGSRRLMNKRLNPLLAVTKSAAITKELGLSWAVIMKGMMKPAGRKKAPGAGANKPLQGSAAHDRRKMKKTSGRISGGIVSSYRTFVRLARMAIGFEAFKKGTLDGDNRKGVLPLGQITGIINDTPNVARVIERIVAEAREVHQALSKKMEAGGI
ncbi:MAG: nitronate monooxygenase [Spirochaetes bacterium]|nr:nitronate monooxygenase [Spirochaetota bacterium]